jgi:DNA polymerase V
VGRCRPLAAIGINTPLDLKRSHPWLIRERLGVATMRLALELRGVACPDLERATPDRIALIIQPAADISGKKLPSIIW